MIMISHLKLPGENYSTTVPGVQIVLVYDYTQSFETPRINNHSFNAIIAYILLSCEDAHYFVNNPK